MEEFIAVYYQLSKSEVEKAEVRARVFERNPNTHTSTLHQPINLDRRLPTTTESLNKDSIDFNAKLIKNYKKDNVIAIDIISNERKLIARYLMVSENSRSGNDSNSSYKYSKGVSFFMSWLGDKVKVYTIEDLI